MKYYYFHRYLKVTITCSLEFWRWIKFYGKFQEFLNNWFPDSGLVSIQCSCWHLPPPLIMQFCRSRVTSFFQEQHEVINHLQIKSKNHRNLKLLWCPQYNFGRPPVKTNRLLINKCIVPDINFDENRAQFHKWSISRLEIIYMHVITTIQNHLP